MKQANAEDVRKRCSHTYATSTYDILWSWRLADVPISSPANAQKQQENNTIYGVLRLHLRVGALPSTRRRRGRKPCASLSSRCWRGGGGQTCPTAAFSTTPPWAPPSQVSLSSTATCTPLPTPPIAYPEERAASIADTGNQGFPRGRWPRHATCRVGRPPRVPGYLLPPAARPRV